MPRTNHIESISRGSGQRKSLLWMFENPSCFHRRPFFEICLPARNAMSASPFAEIVHFTV